MLELLMIVSCAVFFHRAGEAVNSSGFLWATLSVALWFGAGYLTGLWLIGSVGAQVGLFVGFTVWSAMRKPKRYVHPR